MSILENDLTALPDSTYLTLLFKHGTTTTLLSVQPTQSFTSIKSLLLATLTSLSITTFPGATTPLPSKFEDLDLGITRERHTGRDPSRGWVSVDDPEAVTVVTQSRGSKKRGASTNEKGAAEKPIDLDLKDGNYIAYRLKKDIKDLVDEDVDENMSDAEQGRMAWNVVVPSFPEDEEVDEEPDMAQEDEDEDMDIPIPTPRNNIAR